jgi:hypothetical protein
MKQQVEFIHGNSLAANHFSYAIAFWNFSNDSERRFAIVDLLNFFTKSHGVSYDISTVDYLGFRDYSGDQITEKFEWSYKISPYRVEFYVNNAALTTYEFWNKTNG